MCGTRNFHKQLSQSIRWYKDRFSWEQTENGKGTPSQETRSVFGDPLAASSLLEKMDFMITNPPAGIEKTFRKHKYSHMHKPMWAHRATTI